MTTKPGLTEADFQRAAAALAVDVPAVKAVAEIESRGASFLPDGRPPILFEAHIFSRLTNRKFDASYPTLSSPAWNRALYKGGAAEHDRLAAAAKLDRDAALQSCSWGAFQIMGSNWRACGCVSLQAFINAQYAGASQQLDLLVAFLKSTKLYAPLRQHDWARFAKGYNGPGYAKNRYDTKLEAAWRKHGGK